MLYKKLIPFLILILTCFSGFSAIFTVTSNADSGPGTLRGALTQAALADSSVTNYINFNIADQSEPGRTIVLFSQLPDVSSNLVIDGSTQLGANFGVSDARVALFYSTPVHQDIFGLSIINKHDVAVYGLYIKFLTDVTNAGPSSRWWGIALENDKNVQIGAAGKGNVVVGFYAPLIANFPINEAQYFENITLKDNIFGIDADGETLSVNETAGVSLTFIIGQINIGGTIAEGNLFTQGLQLYQGNNVTDDPTNYYGSAPATVNIKNNKFGVDYAVQKQTKGTGSYGLIIETETPGGKNTCFIEDNVIATPNYYAIFIGNNGAPIYMLRNYIGTDKTQTQSFATNGIFVYGATSCAIGSTNPADANYITNCNPVIIWPYSNVTVNKNSFYCTVGAQPMHSVGGDFPFPVISISKISSNSVSGTATPNSSVELFYSDKCGTCSPQSYFASATTDAAGNWQYNGTITGTVIASATLGLNTSDFTQTALDTHNVQIVNSCGDGTGSIKGIIPQSAKNLKWLDANRKVVGTSPDLLNVPLGEYKLLAQNGDCADSTNYFEIKNKFEIDTTNVKRTEPSCGNSLGSITGLNVIDNDGEIPTLTWKDAGGTVLGNTIDLNNVASGSYYLFVQNADASCTQTFGPFSLKNVSGPNIDQSKQSVQSTNCGQSTGSITNLIVTGTGTLKYSWLNSGQQEVGTDKDLQNQPAGTYKLQVTDDTQCGAVYSTDIIIPETNGITIDESKAQTTITMCGLSNGSIIGIQVIGADKYVWANGTSTIVTTTADLTGASPGDYVLTASNGFGCSKTSQSYHIGQQAATVFPQYVNSIAFPCFNQNDGYITVYTDALVKSFRWVNGQGQNVGSDATLKGLAPGVYQLYLTDQNGCESFYDNYTVKEIPEFAVTSVGKVNNDQCGLQSGSISAATVTGGIPPYTYSWLNASGSQISSGDAIANLAAGNYSLNISDVRCGSLLIVYTVNEETDFIPAPLVPNVALCSAGTAIIKVSNPAASLNYRLYDNPASPHPIDEQKGGSFKVTITANQNFYVSQINGTCESARTEVQVSVGLSSADIVNTFTPNGDGINDYWQIKTLASYPKATVQVFTRAGQLVFNSIGYDHPFDGTYNGKKLPAGVYYYVINLGTDCKLLSGSLTIIR